MNKIVIVEDKIKRAICLAEQFRQFSAEHPDYELELHSICLFCDNVEHAASDIAEYQQEFDIRLVTMLDFIKVMDRYWEQEGEDQFFLIMDYILEKDGSDGIPTRRVNIRYARNKKRYQHHQIWFYTGTGRNNEEMLCKLFGAERILQVLQVDNEYIELNLNNPNLINAFTHEDQLVEV